MGVEFELLSQNLRRLRLLVSFTTSPGSPESNMLRQRQVRNAQMLMTFLFFAIVNGNDSLMCSSGFKLKHRINIGEFELD